MCSSKRRRIRRLALHKIVSHKKRFDQNQTQSHSNNIYPNTKLSMSLSTTILTALAACSLPCSDAFTHPILPSGGEMASRMRLHAKSDHSGKSGKSGKSGDLGVRFNKVGRFGNQRSNAITPSFPVSDLNDRDYEVLSRQTLADSVRRDLSFAPHEDVDKYLEDTNVAPPLYPGEEGYWQQLEEVVDMQISRRRGADPSTADATWPELWENRELSAIYPWKDSTNPELTLESVAQSVDFEFSNYHCQDIVAKTANDLNARRKRTDMGQEFSYAVLQTKSIIDFIQLQVRMAQLNSWSLEVVADSNFALKWNYGVPRPEEVAYKITTGEIPAKEVPSELCDKILSMKLTSAESFTAYPGGSPMHPSFPAMHSAGSTCSLWVPALYNITPEQYVQLVLTDWSVSYARTVAGVHYRQDNLAGLNIGQRIIRESLPEHLAIQYGIGKPELEIVRERLEVFSFDWNEFDPKRLTIGGAPVTEFFDAALKQKA